MICSYLLFRHFSRESLRLRPCTDVGLLHPHCCSTFDALNNSSRMIIATFTLDCCFAFTWWHCQGKRSSGSSIASFEFRPFDQDPFKAVVITFLSILDHFANQECSFQLQSLLWVAPGTKAVVFAAFVVWEVHVSGFFKSKSKLDESLHFE